MLAARIKNCCVELSVRCSSACCLQLCWLKSEKPELAVQRDALRYIEMNIRKLDGNNSSVSNSSRGSESTKDCEVVHKQLCAMHHITSGQDLRVHMHVWVNVPGRLGSRQLCPMSFGDHKSSQSQASDFSDGPIFEFVVGKTYFLSFLIQNWDLASPRRMPFSDVIEVLILHIACLYFHFSSVYAELSSSFAAVD
jgi:hypothetical protein